VTGSATSHLARYFKRLDCGQPWCWQGHVLDSLGQTIESAGPVSSVGESCVIIDRQQHAHLAEVVGFRGNHVLTMPVDTTEGIRFGDTVSALGVRPEIPVGPALMGRVLNALGKPLDEGGPLDTSSSQSLDGVVRSPMDRTPIRTALGTGIRAVDTMLTVGRGQRVGIFGGSSTNAQSGSGKESGTQSGSQSSPHQGSTSNADSGSSNNGNVTIGRALAGSNAISRAGEGADQTVPSNSALPVASLAAETLGRSSGSYISVMA